jgi:cytochrome P450
MFLGPRRHIFRDHAWLFYGPRRNQHILEWAEKFGPVFKLNIFGKAHVVVTNPADARELLSNPDLEKYEPLCTSYNEVPMTCLVGHQ